MSMSTFSNMISQVTAHHSQICVATNVENPVSSFCWFQRTHQSHWKWGHLSMGEVRHMELNTSRKSGEIRYHDELHFLTFFAESLCIHKKTMNAFEWQASTGQDKNKHRTRMNTTWPLDPHNCCFSSGLQRITWFIVLTQQEMRPGRQVPLVSLQGLSDWCWEMLTKTSYWFVESSARGVTLVLFY